MKKTILWSVKNNILFRHINNCWKTISFDIQKSSGYKYLPPPFPHFVKNCSAIVLFLASLLKGRFVVFSQQLLRCYFMLGQMISPQGQAIGPYGQSPRRSSKQEKSYCYNTTKRHLRGVDTKETIPNYSYSLSYKVQQYGKLSKAWQLIQKNGICAYI